MREICTSGSVGGEEGNLLAYPALGTTREIAIRCSWHERMYGFNPPSF